jgi:acetyltransferase-like isoleucine patch superfamily enzyme
MIKYLDLKRYYRYYRKMVFLKKFKKVGKNFIFDPFSKIYHAEYIEVGDNVFIGEDAHISGEIKIGNNVMFGPRPMIIGGSHFFAVKGRSVRVLHPKDRENWEPIVVEDEVWCGASIIIPSGVILGMGCVIGAGSILTKSIPPYTVAVGNPCKPIKRIFSEGNLRDHLVSLGKSGEAAKRIVERRKRELYKWNLNNLPIIDKTNQYWEFKT